MTRIVGDAEKEMLVEGLFNAHAKLEIAEARVAELEDIIRAVLRRDEIGGSLEERMIAAVGYQAPTASVGDSSEEAQRVVDETARPTAALHDVLRIAQSAEGLDGARDAIERIIALASDAIIEGISPTGSTDPR